MTGTTVHHSSMVTRFLTSSIGTTLQALTHYGADKPKNSRIIYRIGFKNGGEQSRCLQIHFAIISVFSPCTALMGVPGTT